MKNEFIKKIEKIVKIIFVVGIVGFGALNLIFAVANDLWCRYMHFFETGIRICFWILWGCVAVLVTIRIIKKHIRF